jgi:hypothetical protein
MRLTPALLSLSLDLFGTGSSSAQVRPGLAHRLEETEPTARAAAAVTHDPDYDGALIGAAVGAVGLSVILAARCGGGDYCAGAGVFLGAPIGGLAGLVLGGLVDAADPLTPRGETTRAVARDSTLAAAPGLADSTPARRPRSPTSRRNDLVGAAIGAVAGDLLVYAACTSISEGGSCPIFHWKYWPAIGIGALLGAGIGSAFGDPEEKDASAEKNESP